MKKMIEQIFTHPLTLGAGGATAVQAVNQAIPTPEQITSIGNLLVQVVIAAVTIWGIIKKAKSNKK